MSIKFYYTVIKSLVLLEFGSHQIILMVGIYNYLVPQIDSLGHSDSISNFKHILYECMVHMTKKLK